MTKRLLAALAAVFVLTLPVQASDKVTFCHATGSETNPYVLITTAPQAVKAGHIDHQHDQDIIPQFTIESGPHAGTYGPQGDQSILANGCVVPTPEPTEEPTDEPPDETPGPTPSPPDETNPPSGGPGDVGAGPGEPGESSQVGREDAPGRRPLPKTGDGNPLGLAETGASGLGWLFLLLLALFAVGITLTRFNRR